MMIKSILLPLAPLQAFELFTVRVSDWWPTENRHTNDPLSTLHMLDSGRFFERASDGREIELGRIVAWDEGRRLLFDFYVATGPDRPTQVEVQFEAEVEGTRVTVSHGPMPRSAELWGERAPRYARAWERVLAALKDAAAPQAR